MAVSREIIPCVHDIIDPKSWNNTCSLPHPLSVWDRYFKEDNYDNYLESVMSYLRSKSPVSSGSTNKTGEDKFQVNINVNNFNPEELEVKVVDNDLVIHGKHGDKMDGHGFVRREFTRRYPLPENTSTETLKASFIAGDILHVEVQKKAEETTERIIPIIVESNEKGMSFRMYS